MSIFKDSFYQPIQCGEPNMDNPLRTFSVPAGAVSIGDCLRLQLRATLKGTPSTIAGGVIVEMNNAGVASFSLSGAGSGKTCNIQIVRTGSATGTITTDGAADTAASTFDWGHAQDIVIFGSSNTINGLTIERAHVER